MIGDKDCTTCKHFDQAKPGGEALVCADCPEYGPENTEEVVYLSKWEPLEEVVPKEGYKCSG